MILTLQTHGHRTLEDVRRFLSGNESVDFVLCDRDAAYAFVVKALRVDTVHQGDRAGEKGVYHVKL